MLLSTLLVLFQNFENTAVICFCIYTSIGFEFVQREKWRSIHIIYYKTIWVFTACSKQGSLRPLPSGGLHPTGNDEQRLDSWQIIEGHSWGDWWCSVPSRRAVSTCGLNEWTDALSRLTSNSCARRGTCPRGAFLPWDSLGETRERASYFATPTVQFAPDLRPSWHSDQ